MDKPKIKVLTIFGTRKELIRLYPVIEKIKADAQFESILVTSSQLEEDFDELYDLFNITPDHDLNLRRNRTSLSDIANLVLSGIEPLLNLYRPDLMLVQGESTTAFISSLAAYYNKIPVGHIGAGERSPITKKPQLAELNHRLISNLSNLHFVFDAASVKYLIFEGAIPKAIFVTGSTIIETITRIACGNENTLQRHIPVDDNQAYKMILVTVSKRENSGRPLVELCNALNDLTQVYPNLKIVFQIDFNADAKETVYKMLYSKKGIHLFEKMPYKIFVEAIGRSAIVITDSFFIAEESTALQKPVLLFQGADGQRDWHLYRGVKNIRCKRTEIVFEASHLIKEPIVSANLPVGFYPAGDGQASERILTAIKQHFGLTERPTNYRPEALKVPRLHF